MAIEHNPPVAAPRGTAYGWLFRERGTQRLFLVAVALGVVWFLYSTIHTSQMNSVQWPALKPDSHGLTIVGLRDQNRPGWHRKYVAIESNHEWAIRRPDDDTGDEDTSSDSSSPEAADRGANPGASHHVNRGEVVPVEEVLANCPVVLTQGQFTGASVEQRKEIAPPPFDRTYWIVHIGLTEEGLSRFWQFSSQHEGERLAFILNGEVLTCTKMENTPPPYLYVFVHSLDVEPIWIKADADRLADYINAHKAR